MHKHILKEASGGDMQTMNSWKNFLYRICIFAVITVCVYFIQPSLKEKAAISIRNSISVAGYEGMYGDGKEIQKALDKVQEYSCEDGEYVIVEVPSGIYLLESKLKIYSHTYLKLDDNTTIKNSPSRKSGSMLSNYYEKQAGGYAGSSDIIIEGGTWDGNTKECRFSRGFSNMAFAHAENITIKNVRILHNYEGHLIEFAGVRFGEINRCILRGFKGKSRKEAVQLDIMHDKKMFPAFGVYDDTACDSIIICNNIIGDFPRGTGSHTGVEGIFHQNITIKNNYFYRIKEEGIDAYCYKNLKITDNSFTDTGTAIEYKTTSKNGKKDFFSPLKKDNPHTVNYFVEINNNTINNLNKTSDITKSTGIRLIGGSRFRIGRVSIRDNKIAVYHDAIYMYFTQQCFIKNNHITQSEYAIHLKESAHAAIENNKIENAGQSGIALNTQSINNRIAYNDIRESGKHGIQIYEISQAVIRENTVLKSRRDGISVSKKSDYCEISNNIIKESGKFGISVFKAEKADIRNNKLAGSKEKHVNISG